MDTDASGCLYVLDENTCGGTWSCGAPRLVIYNTDGSYQGSFEIPESDGNSAAFLTINKVTGNIYLASYDNADPIGEIREYSSSHVFLHGYSDIENSGNDVIAGSDGYLYYSINLFNQNYNQIGGRLGRIRLEP